MEYQAGTVVVVKNGKAEDRWLVENFYPATDDKTWLGATVGARRWIKKHKRWSTNAYLIGVGCIVRVEQ